MDDCRIPFVDEKDPSAERYKTSTNGFTEWGGTIGNSVVDYKEQQGRFPANLLCSDDVLNDGSITSQGEIKLHKISGWGDKIKKNSVIYKGDKGTNSRYYDIDKWFEQLLNNEEE